MAFFARGKRKARECRRDRERTGGGVNQWSVESNKCPGTKPFENLEANCAKRNWRWTERGERPARARTRSWLMLSASFVPEMSLAARR